MVITDDQLKEWRELADAATPGPWEWRRLVLYAPIAMVPHAVTAMDAAAAWSTAADDSQFIAASRTAVPALIDEVERLRAIVTAADERMAGVLDGTFCDGDGTAQREIARLRALNDVWAETANDAMKEADQLRAELVRLRADRREYFLAGLSCGASGDFAGFSSWDEAADDCIARFDAIDAAEAKERGDG